MSHQNILNLVLKIAAIFIFVDIVNTLPNQLGDYGNAVDSGMQASIVKMIWVPLVTKSLVMLLLWFFPNLFIKSVVSEQEYTDELKQFYKNLDVAVLTGIGVYLVAFSIGDLAYFIVLKMEMQSLYSQSLPPQEQASFVASMVQVIVGLVLIIGNRGITILLKKARV